MLLRAVAHAELSNYKRGSEDSFPVTHTSPASAGFCFGWFPRKPAPEKPHIHKTNANDSPTHHIGHCKSHQVCPRMEFQGPWHDHTFSKPRARSPYHEHLVTLVFRILPPLELHCRRSLKSTCPCISIVESSPPPSGGSKWVEEGLRIWPLILDTQAKLEYNAQAQQWAAIQGHKMVAVQPLNPNQFISHTLLCSPALAFFWRHFFYSVVPLSYCNFFFLLPKIQTSCTSNSVIKCKVHLFYIYLISFFHSFTKNSGA